MLTPICCQCDSLQRLAKFMCMLFGFLSRPFHLVYLIIYKVNAVNVSSKHLEFLLLYLGEFSVS